MGRLMGYTIPYAWLRFFMGMIHGISDDTLYAIPTERSTGRPMGSLMVCAIRC